MRNKIAKALYEHDYPGFGWIESPKYLAKADAVIAVLDPQVLTHQNTFPSLGLNMDGPEADDTQSHADDLDTLIQVWQTEVDTAIGTAIVLPTIRDLLTIAKAVRAIMPEKPTDDDGSFQFITSQEWELIQKERSFPLNSGTARRDDAFEAGRDGHFKEYDTWFDKNEGNDE